MDFPVYFFERELEKFLRVLDTNDAEHKDLAAAYDTLYAQVKSGFGGALKVTPELIEEFYSHTKTKLEESMPQSRTRIWLSCLRDEIAALLPMEETEKDDDDEKKETEQCERETEEIKSKITKLRHITVKLSEAKRKVSKAIRKLELIEAKRNPWPASKLTKVLENTFGFDLNNDDDIQGLMGEYPPLVDLRERGALVFNYHDPDYYPMSRYIGPYLISECEQPEELLDENDDYPDIPRGYSVERIYQEIIRKAGWCLVESPLDMYAWILAPTKDCQEPIKTLTNAGTSEDDDDDGADMISWFQEEINKLHI